MITHPMPSSRVERITALLHQARTSVATLSPREREVLATLSEGCATKEIAARLAISFATARTHLERIFAKLGVTSRAAAAAQWGLLSAADSALGRTRRREAQGASTSP